MKKNKEPERQPIRKKKEKMIRIVLKTIKIQNNMKERIKLKVFNLKKKTKTPTQKKKKRKTGQYRPKNNKNAKQYERKTCIFSFHFEDTHLKKEEELLFNMLVKKAKKK